MQRITAGMLIPLFIWFVGSMVVLATGNHTEVVELLRSPIAAGASLMLIIAIFYHAALGLQVVIEDYIRAEGTQIAAIIIMRFAMGRGACSGGALSVGGFAWGARMVRS